MNLKYWLMFGLEKIAWTDFLNLIIIILLLWYLVLLVRGFWNEKLHQKKDLFEQAEHDDFSAGQVAPLKVSEKDFSSNLIVGIADESISLLSAFYEDTGLDEGYELDYFLGGHEATLFSILSQVQSE
jgi:flagellar biogenesis protein FliO